MHTWIEVLTAYHEGKFGRYFHGLTPRLIVGASQSPRGAKFDNYTIAYDVTKELFLEMQNFNEDGLIVTSNFCNLHDGPVFKLVESEWSNTSIGTDFNEVWNSYGNDIVNGEFGIDSYDKEILDSL